MKYCPTEQMTADYFTKPLQGTLFRKLRDFIMGIENGPVKALYQAHRSVLKDKPDPQTEKARPNKPKTVGGGTWAVVANGKWPLREQGKIDQQRQS